MKSFEFEITEVLSRIVEIKAHTKEEAYEIITSMYENEEIVLDYSDFKELDIKENERC